MMLDYFQGVVSGIEAKLAAGPLDTVARKMLTLELARLGVRLFDGQHRVAWCGIATPFDLLAALEVTPCFVEFVGASLASTGAAGGMLQAAEGAGYSTDGCAYHRSVVAADLAGLMPRADVLVGTSSPCSGGLAVVEGMAARHERDLFLLHVPPDDSEASVDFFAAQLGDLVAFLEDHLGQRLDPERLRRAVELSNQARAALAEAFELASRSPAPARRRDMVNVGITLPLLFGTEDGVRVAEAYRDELAARALTSEAVGAPRERVRLMWLQNRIQFRHDLDDVLADELGAVVAAEELNQIWWPPLDPDEPLRSMARRALTNPLMLSAQRRIETLAEMAARHDIDGAINPCHWGCRQGTGSRGLVQQGLRRHGVPVLNLEVDCVDARNFAPGQVRTRLEAFVEMLVRQRADGTTAQELS